MGDGAPIGGAWNRSIQPLPASRGGETLRLILPRSFVSLLLCPLPSLKGVKQHLSVKLVVYVVAER